MQLGMIGLGRMGANMVRRLMKGGHECVVYDVHADACAAIWPRKAPSAPIRSMIFWPGSPSPARSG